MYKIILLNTSFYSPLFHELDIYNHTSSSCQSVSQCIFIDLSILVTEVYQKLLCDFSSELLGECVGRFTNRKVPYCVSFNPDEDKQHIFVAGMSDKKIVQVSANETFLYDDGSLPEIPVNTKGGTKEAS